MVRKTKDTHRAAIVQTEMPCSCKTSKETSEETRESGLQWARTYPNIGSWQPKRLFWSQENSRHNLNPRVDIFSILLFYWINTELLNMAGWFGLLSKQVFLIKWVMRVYNFIIITDIEWAPGHWLILTYSMQDFYKCCGLKKTPQLHFHNC